MKKKSNAGRPTVVTPEVLLKLEEAYLMDCTDLEACFYANISKTTLYVYQEKHPEFQERKEWLKQNNFIKARRTIANHLDDNYSSAVDYMSRKKKDEFAQRNELTGKEGAALIKIAPEEREVIEQALHGFINNGNS